MGAAFPMYGRPLLAEWLASSSAARIQAVVADLLAGAPTDTDDVVAAAVEQLQIPGVRLGQRFHERQPWRRSMRADGHDLSLLRRGIRPGDSYTVEYDVYRVEIGSGAECITCGANGGPAVDPTFMFVEQVSVVLRAADAQHRVDLERELDEHVKRANALIDDWNSNGLVDAVRRELNRAMRFRAKEERRAAEAEAAGYAPMATRDSNGQEPSASSMSSSASDPTRALSTPSGTEPQRAPSNQSAVSEPTGITDRRAPTALISWAHRDAGFTGEQERERETSTVRLANCLRENGIDADIDVFHQHEAVDWTRWGPGRMREVDFVLVVCSEGWNRAWRGDAGAGAGATAEADVLKSWFAHERARFDGAVQLVILPDEHPPIPEGLDRVVRHSVSAWTREGTDSLLRSLTRQPRYVPVPVGVAPILPPEEDQESGSHADRTTRTYRSAHGELRVAYPERLPQYVQQVVDDLITREQREFDSNEGTAAELEESRSTFPVVNHSTIEVSVVLRTDKLISLVVECDYVMPGSAVSYQRSVGLSFDTATECMLRPDDVFIDDPVELTDLNRALVDSACSSLGDAVTATALPPNATFAVRTDALGVATSRYDIGPGSLGAPVIWIAHDRLARLYRPGFARLLPPQMSSATAPDT